jgi:bifunctional UDP-N-acetylglucosamine pyrophosphorylase/glucosamine-1-phosphate N-acetyltransferase
MRSRTAKPLHTVAGLPVIDYVLAAATSAEPDSIVVVLSPPLAGNVDLTAHITTDRPAPTRIAVQRETLGTGDALRSAMGEIGEADRVLVLFADHPLLTPESVLAMLETSRSKNATVVLLTCVLDNAAGYGRIERQGGAVVRIIERKDDDPAQRDGPTEVNSGMMVVEGKWLKRAIGRLTASPHTGEFYLTELVELAVADGLGVTAVHGQPQELIGINDRIDLARVEEIAYNRIREQHQRSGVTITSPSTVLIEAGVTIGEDTLLLPGTIVRAGSVIGSGCEIGPNSVLTEATIGDNCRVTASFVTASTLRDGSDVGPFSHVRGNSVIEAGVHVGNFAEIKNSSLAERVRMGHFSYAGDASIGAGTNIGAGTVTCNFDGTQKHRTVIGERVFVGSDSMLVAPVTIGDDAILGAGSVVTRDVAPGDMVVGVPARSRRGKIGKDGEQG